MAESTRRDPTRSNLPTDRQYNPPFNDTRILLLILALIAVVATIVIVGNWTR